MFLSKLNLNWFVSGSRLLSDSKAIFMSTSDGAALSMNRIQMCKKYDFFILWNYHAFNEYLSIKREFKASHEAYSSRLSLGFILGRYGFVTFGKWETNLYECAMMWQTDSRADSAL